jgi:MFS family permease
MRLSARRQVMLAVFWFGISFVWGALINVTLPFLLFPEHPGPGNPALVSAGEKNTALGVLESVGLVVAIIVQPASGALSDRLSTRWGRRRPLIAIGAAGAAASVLLLAVSPVFLILIAVYCLLQFSMNVAQGAYQGLLPDTVAAAQRGAASGYLGIATLLGQVVGAIAGGVLAPRLTCFVIAGVVLLTAGLTLLGVPERAVAHAIRAARSGGHGAARALAALRGYLAEFARYPDFCWVVASRFLLLTGLAAVQRFAAYYISDAYRGRYELFGIHLGSAQTATSILLAVLIFSGMLVTYPAVRLSDRIGRRKILVGAGVSGAVGALLLFTAASLTQVVLYAIFVALCFGAFVSVDWAFMADLAPRRRAGKFLGFSNLATAGSQAAAPAFLAPVVDVVNRQTASGGAPGTGGYRVLFIASALFFALGALALARVRPTPPPDHEDDVSVRPASALAA